MQIWRSPIPMQSLTITRPDDWHLHVRDGAVLASLVPQTARCFARAIIMPNLHPPVTTTAMAGAYRERILAALPPGARFEPLMTLYLNDGFDVNEVARAKASGIVHAIKLYPKGVARAEQPGVSAIERCFAVLEAMQQHDLPLLVHGEVTDTSVDIFAREQAFIDRVLAGLVRRFPRLRIVFEHISTAEAVQFVQSAPDTVAATITAHHLLLNRNAIFEGGLQPHHYCIPVLKREEHRGALLGAAVSGHPKFFLGTDSAPHARHAKETRCGCAGVYTAHAAIEFYAEAFEHGHALERLEAFASFHGPDFYRLPRNRDTITLRKEPWRVLDAVPFGEREKLVPLRAGGTVSWRLAARGDEQQGR